PHAGRRARGARSCGGMGTAHPGLRPAPAATPREAVEGLAVIVTAGPILARPDPAIRPEWVSEGALGVPLDYDSYWKPEALAAADRFLTDDTPQLLGTRAGGVFFQRIPAVYADLGEVAAGLKDGRRHDRERLICLNLG